MKKSMNETCLHERVSKEIVKIEDGSWVSTGDYICDLCNEIFAEDPNKIRKELD